MKWEVMDCRELKYENDQFDLIIDKSTIDAMLCGEEAYLSVLLMMRECQRVLKTGGFYVAISYGAPEKRINHFKRECFNFDIQVDKIELK